MVRALILYTSGKFDVTNLKGFREYQKYVEGNVELLQIKRAYLSNNDKKKRLMCYVNDEGLARNLPLNPWACILDLLGVYIPWGYGGIYGNVIAFTENIEEEEEGNIDQYVIDTTTKFSECVDEDTFLCELETLQKGNLKKTVKPNQSNNNNNNNNNKPLEEPKESNTNKSSDEEPKEPERKRKRKEVLLQKDSNKDIDQNQLSTKKRKKDSIKETTDI
jgi:hypothetical protein